MESIVADHIIRRYNGFALYHRAPQGEEEIDLVVHHQKRRARIEVKYRSRITPRDARWLAKYGGGIIATVDELDWYPDMNVAAIPVMTLLAGYSEAVSLYPSRV